MFFKYMSELLDSLQEYFDNTSKEQLGKDWEKLKEWENVGPSVEEYINYLKGNKILSNVW